MKPLYIRTTKCRYRHKNLDYWYLLNKYSPETQIHDVFFTSWMKSLIKCESWTIDQNVLSRGEEKGLIVKDPSLFKIKCVKYTVYTSLKRALPACHAWKCSTWRPALFILFLAGTLIIKANKQGLFHQLMT